MGKVTLQSSNEMSARVDARLFRSSHVLFHHVCRPLCNVRPFRSSHVLLYDMPVTRLAASFDRNLQELNYTKTKGQLSANLCPH